MKKHNIITAMAFLMVMSLSFTATAQIGGLGKALKQTVGDAASKA